MGYRSEHDALTPAVEAGPAVSSAEDDGVPGVARDSLSSATRAQLIVMSASTLEIVFATNVGLDSIDTSQFRESLVRSSERIASASPTAQDAA